VLFPLPDGPTKEIKEAGSIARSTSRIALTVISPAIYVFSNAFAVTSAIIKLDDHYQNCKQKDN
jgi:hypothetical protein